MRNQNHQEVVSSKGRQVGHHKKVQKFEVLLKYKSLFHHKQLQTKDIMMANQKNFTTSINRKDLSKTLLAYYSVNSNLKDV